MADKYFDIIKEKKKIEKENKQGTKLHGGYLKNKKNVYDELNKAGEVHGMSEEEKDIFED